MKGVILLLMLKSALAQYVMTNANIYTAVREWKQDSVAAEAKYGAIGTWDTFGVTNMNGLFAGTQSRRSDFNADISAWNTASVTSMNKMFNYAEVFNQNLGIWNVSQVTDMGQMFYQAKKFRYSLRYWCTTSIPEQPFGFCYTDPCTFPGPAWGTCPIPPTKVAKLVVLLFVLFCFVLV